jgi:pimeloyl-ACP methyl ester carboxylesterase
MSYFDPPAYDGFTGAVTSRDGTVIAFDRSGDGSPVILVDGVAFHRAYGPTRSLAKHLTGRGFRVYAYDRRGRGESVDSGSYSAEREVEDIAALIEEAGCPVHLFAATSGVVLALEAVNNGLDVQSLALFDPPFVVDGSRRPLPAGFAARLDELIETGRLADAQASYLGSQVPILRPLMPLLRRTRSFRRSLAFVPSLSRDLALFADLQAGKPLPPDRWREVTAPMLVVTGRRSPTWTRHAAQALADALPDAQVRTLTGEGHFVRQESLAEVLAEFFASRHTPG